jgi:hypothetical protein
MSGWNWLGRSADVLQVLAVVFSGYAALRLYRQSQQLKEIARALPAPGNFKELVKAYEGVKSSNPVAFAISLVRGSVTVKHSVQTFLDHKRWKMPISELNMEGINNVEDMEEFLTKLLIKKREFEAAGHTEVHLFIAAPMPACVQVGAVFDNWLPVKLYHKPQVPPPQVYEYWMPLTK